MPKGLLPSRIFAVLLLSSLLLGSSVPATASGPENDLEMLEQFWQETYDTTEPQRAMQTGKIQTLGAIFSNDPFATLNRTLLAKAQPDECFDGIGNPVPPGQPCVQGIPKVNQAYVWGLAKSGTRLWFGTAPNVHCLVFGGYLGVTLSHQTDSWVCEFGESPYAPPLPAYIGDWRSPHLYAYDTANGSLVDVSPVADPLFPYTLGIRSAGSIGDIVLFGGPGLQGGINLFAYHTQTGAYLGSANLPQYNNIRKWLIAKGGLYTTVGNTAGGGSVLRWNKNPKLPGYPFLFDVVGVLDTPGSELALHENRLFVSTWPSAELQGTNPMLASLWMSPTIPNKGLTPAHTGAWDKVWQVNAYEPDPITALTYGGGALASYKGYLYWGTMHVPFLAGIAHMRVYGQPEEPEEVLAMLLGGHRAISIFRGKHFGKNNVKIELVYGLPALPVYTPEGGWQIAPNNMGALPKQGLSGFGNFFNNYTWTMAVYNNQLFVGTMDWSYLLKEGLVALLESLGVGVPDRELQLPEMFYGADLFRFYSPQKPAIPESLSGVGNYTSYGIRTMLPDQTGLYLGMANPMNLLTDLNDDRPEGGWELILLR